MGDETYLKARVWWARMIAALAMKAHQLSSRKVVHADKTEALFGNREVPRDERRLYKAPRSMKVIVADRGQVTIPKELRKRLGIQPRTVLDFQEENGCLVARKVETSDPVAEVRGCLKLNRSTDAILADLRGKV